jgi:hypothetical protein
VDRILVNSLAQAWPNIRDLVLGLVGGNSPPQISILDLAIFAVYCHDLQSLSLAVDATSQTVPNVDPLMGHKHQKAILLDFGNSQVTSRVCTAATLSGIFANVTSIYAMSQHREAWKEVHTMLEVFNTVREHERSGMALPR